MWCCGVGLDGRISLADVDFALGFFDRVDVWYDVVWASRYFP